VVPLLGAFVAWCLIKWCLSQNPVQCSTSAPVAPTFNTVSRGYLPPKSSPQNACESGERHLATGACAAPSSGYGAPVDWTSQPDAQSTQDTTAPEPSTLPSVYDDHHQLNAQRTESVVDASPLGYFIYDGSQDFHGQVVVF
jgi:hypothetical protein